MAFTLGILMYPAIKGSVRVTTERVTRPTHLRHCSPWAKEAMAQLFVLSPLCIACIQHAPCITRSCGVVHKEQCTVLKDTKVCPAFKY